MAQPPRNFQSPQTPDQTTGSGCLIRLAWMVVGNGLLLVCAILIAGHKESLLSVTDAVFWAAVPVLAWLRRIDIVRLNGRTIDGRPATLADWRRYVKLLPAIALALWLAAHAAAWFTR
jgi:hypothetical protein